MKPEYRILEDGTIHIYSSWRVRKDAFMPTLKEIAEDNFGNPVIENRSLEELKYEWAINNFLYKLGFGTKDMDFKWPVEKRTCLGYNIFGFLVWPLIK